MRIAIVFNQRISVPSSPASLHVPGLNLGSVIDDTYAEWDDPETIQAVYDALSTEHDVSLIEANVNAYERLRDEAPELVFNMAEGLLGEFREAQIPAMLDFLGIPYTGSDPVTLGITLDKQRTKEILSWHKLPTPRFFVVESERDLPARAHYPLIIKPLSEGSSKGIFDSSLVYNRKELIRQVREVGERYGRVIVEEFLPGREFTVALLGNKGDLKVLPIVEIDFSTLPKEANPIYSYEAKWIWDTEKDPLQIFTCPARIDQVTERKIEKLCRRTFEVFNCRDWCRIDVRLDNKGEPHVLELNPLPGIFAKARAK